MLSCKTSVWITQIAHEAYTKRQMNRTLRKNAISTICSKHSIVYQRQVSLQLAVIDMPIFPFSPSVYLSLSLLLSSLTLFPLHSFPMSFYLRFVLSSSIVPFVIDLFIFRIYSFPFIIFFHYIFLFISIIFCSV